MVFEQIEKLKSEYTDKYVRVDSDRPELARFQNVVGQIRTVNMSGRALVEFLDYHDNLGWYDIDLDYLRVVDKPEPKQETAKPARKAAPAAKKPAPAAAGEGKKLSPLELARMQGPAKKKAGTNGDAPAASPAEKPKEPASGKKLSVAEMLAAARAEKQPAAKAVSSTAAAVEVEEEAPAAEQEETLAAPAAEQPSTGTIDKSKMSVADMIAWCRQRDAQ